MVIQNKMKIADIVLVLSFIVTLYGCGGGGGNSGNSDSSSSASSEFASDMTASNPESLPSGAILSINPEITLESDLLSGNSVRASYKNFDSSNFPIGNYDIDLSMVDTGKEVQLEFTVPAGFPDKTVKLVLTNFEDLGATGHIDKFIVDASVDNIGIGGLSGYFRGRKPLNKKISNPVDIYRTPTESELRKYILGKWLYFKILEYDNRLEDDPNLPKLLSDEIIRLKSDKSVEVMGEASVVKWNHVYENGQHSFEIGQEFPVEDPGVDVQEVAVYITYDLQFSSFQEGTWKWTRITVETNQESVVYDSSEVGGLASGIWNRY